MSPTTRPRHAIVLGGGRSRRMGTDKLALPVAGTTVLQRTCTAALTWAEEVVVAGPARPWSDERVRFAGEDPPFGGPVAGLAAALAALPDEPAEVLLLAGDLADPAAIVARLAAADLGPDGVVLLADDGWPQLLAGRYRLQALRTALAAAPRLRDIGVHRVLGTLELARIPTEADILGDLDTPTQARAAGIDPDF
ncbi:molybdenum cofactor guanylyltransferase [Enemella sp. A6]|uniref:molybdenum cofactor guanylyltransferase n=1 Tax=Enemella sp. A6 TaxID=3440152 RepID=UPI003EBD13C6